MGRSGRRRAARLLSAALATLALPLVAVPVADGASEISVSVSWTRPGVSGTSSPPAALRVGDEVTIEVDLVGLDHRSCEVLFHHLGTGGLMSAGQSNETAQSGEAACPPWTFIVPPAPPGTIQVFARASGAPPDAPDDPVELTAPFVHLSLELGGASRAYATTYPTPSWAPVDFIGTDAPRFGEPLVFAAPPGASRLCSYSLTGDWQQSVGVRSLEVESCAPWELTLPDLRPGIVATQPDATPWEAVVVISGGTRDDAIGSYRDGTMSSALVRFGGAGESAWASSHPMALLPEATNPRFRRVGDAITLRAETRLVPDGTPCLYTVRRPDQAEGREWDEYRGSVTGGSCGPVTIDAELVGMYDVAVHVGDPALVASRVIEVVEALPQPTLAADPAVAGEPFDVTSAVSAGLPAEYTFTLAPDSATAAAGDALMLAAGTQSCGSGSLDVLERERSAAGRCPAQPAGTYELTVRCVDVTGAARARVVAVNVDEPGAGVVDIIGHRFESDIRWLYAQRITGGCAPDRFCPDRSVTREQMASFLARALGLPNASRDYFADDESSAHEGDINRLAAAGITGGCAAGRFCPGSTVTREQMASFLARALALANAPRDYFTDDESSAHESDINRLAAAGITGGCAVNRFCPGASVTRGQMAAFLHRALD